MVSPYPSNIPPYNSWRYITPESVDLSNRRVVVIDAPFALMRTILGAINLLTEVYAWTTESTLTPEEIVDIVNNEVTIVAICDAVAGCIANSEDVEEELQQWLQGDDTAVIVQNIIQQNIGQNGYMPSSVQANTDNDLDCVYGALVDAYEIVLDAWLTVKTAVDGAVSLVDAITDITDLIPNPSKPALEGLDIAITVGTAAYDAWINSQTVQDQWVCGVFDAICERGEPYTMQQSDIVAGFNAMTNAPIPPMTDVVRFATQPGQLQSYWALRTDDSCSNDWQAKCSCTPVEWCHVIGFSAGIGGFTLTAGNYDGTRIGNIVQFGGDVIGIERPLSATITSITVSYTSDESSVFATDGFYARLDGVQQYVTQIQVASQPTELEIWSGSQAVSSFGVEFFKGGNPVENTKFVYTVEVCGTGTNPFS